MTGRPPPARRGFALAVALFAVVLIGALVAGVLFAARQAMRMDSNVRDAARALAAAEAGLAAALDGGRLPSLAPGEMSAFAGSLPSGTGSFAGTVLRLNRAIFLVRSSGTDAGGLSRRSVAWLVRPAPVALPADATLSVTDELVVGPGSSVDGGDSPPDASCPPAGGAVPGILLGPAASLDLAGCADSSCVRGAPPVRLAGAAEESASRAAAAAARAALAASGSKVYDAAEAPLERPGAVGSAAACDTSVRGNWGGAAVPACARYFPIVHARGNLSVLGGSGQGVLLVDGDLTVDGGFTFDGPVLVGGRLIVQGAGARFRGSVRARSAALTPSAAGSAEFVFSRCALDDALLANAPVRPLGERAWAELY